MNNKSFAALRKLAAKGTANWWDRHGSKIIGSAAGGLTTAGIAKLFGASNKAALLWGLPGMGIGYVAGAATGGPGRDALRLAKTLDRLKQAGHDYKFIPSDHSQARAAAEEHARNLAMEAEKQAEAFQAKWGNSDYQKLAKTLAAKYPELGISVQE